MRGRPVYVFQTKASKNVVAVFSSKKDALTWFSRQSALKVDRVSFFSLVDGIPARGQTVYDLSKELGDEYG